MTLNDLLTDKGIEPGRVLVLRHRPPAPKLNKVLPWLAAEKPHVFNAYQQHQGKQLESVMQKMQGAGYVASFIGNSPGKALFIGLYEISSSKRLTREQYWQLPANIELRKHGMGGASRPFVLWFELRLSGFYTEWKGKLIVAWPPPERSWWRRAHRNEIPVHAVLENSALDAAMPEWQTITLTWEELEGLPTHWKGAMSEWRGVYYIFDVSDNVGYVGSAYGQDNLLGRWLVYAASGHGGNKLLRKRDPRNFRFSILERVSPDMSEGDVIRLEATWKERLHTRSPHGLNDN